MNTVRELTLPIDRLSAMKQSDRSALLLLGLLGNELNWLRKLLVKSHLGIADDPEGLASGSLAFMLATILAGKVHEGWNRMQANDMRAALSKITIPTELKTWEKELEDRLKSKIFLRIRNNVGFHYPKRGLDFKKLSPHLDDSDASVYGAPDASAGQVLFHISTLAALEPLAALNPDGDYLAALQAVFTEVIDTTALFGSWLAEVTASFLLHHFHGVQWKEVEATSGRPGEAGLMRFFVSVSDLMDFPGPAGSTSSSSAPAFRR